VAVRTALSLDSLAVDRDARRLEQAVQNLVANAVQHSPRGAEVRVVVEAARRQGRDYVLCRVEDEGPGIPVYSQPRVFEPFFTRRKSGTGLGLPIVERFVEAHGGLVVAENRPLRGAAFTIWLPMASVEGGVHV
jgi:signal transduction histidine kinase